MPDDPILLIIGVILFIMLGAFFGSSETAFTTADRFRLRVRADNGSKSAKLALFVTKHIDNTIVTMLICNSILQTAMSVLATLFFVRLFPANQEAVATLISTIFVAVIIFVLCDSIPKFIAHAYPEKVAMFNSYFASVLVIILFPLSFIFNGLNSLFKLIFKFKEDTELTEEDFSNVIESIEEQGGIDEQASDIIFSSLDFTDTSVKEIITPKLNIVALDIDKLTTKKLNEFILNTKYSRIPIYKGSIDNIIGVIVVREYIKAFVNNKKLNLKKVLGKVYFVSNKTTLIEILDGFKKNNTHIVFVRDDSKKLIGMATMEDVLEELVGKIAEPLDRTVRGGR